MAEKGGFMDCKQFWMAVLKRPVCLLIPLFKTRWMRFIPDEPYLCFQYWVITGKKLHLALPVTFNEKIQWLKLHDRKPLYRILTDKYQARDFVKNYLGEEHMVPLLGVWGNPAIVDISTLPKTFVLKCTHGYGSTILCRDKEALDMVNARKKLKISMATKYDLRGREWAYGNAKPRIVAEALLDDGGGERPADYKFMCFHGHVEYICVSRSLGTKNGCVSFFSSDGIRAPFKRIDYPDFPGVDIFPSCLEEMKTAAETLAHAIEAPFIRIDFYVSKNNFYFSEFTFYPCGGTMFLDPPQYDMILGNLLKL